MRWYRRSSRLRQSARGECTAPSGLLGLRAGFAADALRFLAALLDVAETVTEPGIADPDDGARIAYAVGLQGHRGWMVGGEHAHPPRRIFLSGDAILSGCSWSSIITAIWVMLRGSPRSAGPDRSSRYVRTKVSGVAPHAMNRSKLPIRSPSRVSGWVRASASWPARVTVTQPRPSTGVHCVSSSGNAGPAAVLLT